MSDISSVPCKPTTFGRRALPGISYCGGQGGHGGEHGGSHGGGSFLGRLFG